MARKRILTTIVTLMFAVGACDEDSAEPAEESGGSEVAAPGDGDSDPATDPGTDPGAEPEDGPILEPSLLIDVSGSGATSIDQLALSPSGDEVVVQWRDTEGEPRLTIYDTSDGSEVVTAATEREGELFWLSASEIVMVGFGGVFNFDATSLVEGALTAVDPPSCGRSTIDFFDRLEGIYFGAFNNTEVCRLDLSSGEVVTYTGVNRVGVVAPEVGGDNVYISEAGDDDLFFRVTLDAASLEETARESSDRPAVLAATPESSIRLQATGSRYALQPADVEIPNGIFVAHPSYTGQYYALWQGGDVLLLDAASGEIVGRIEETSANNGQNIFDWNNDDTIVAVFNEAFEVAIFQLD